METDAADRQTAPENSERVDLVRSLRIEQVMKTQSSTSAPVPRHLDDPFLTVAELAAYTRTSIKTIYDWRLRGVGPVGVKVGRAVLFRASAVESWLGEREAA